MEESGDRRARDFVHDHRYGRQRADAADHDRMPVVLDKADIGPWPNGEAGTELLKPAGGIAFACGRVQAGQ